MSHRPINQKRAARMRKAMTRRSLPGFIDPVKWLRDRGYADTAGGARKVILADRLKSESHVVGVTQEPRRQPDGTIKNERVIARVPVAMAKNLRVVAA